MKNIFLLCLVITACSTNRPVTTANLPETEAKRPQQSAIVNAKLFTSVYQQTAAEYKALCIQAFNMARTRLDQSLQAATDKPRAIITDIDETILDNSRYAIHMASLGSDYEPLSWSEWIERSEADTIAGAAAFLKYAASKGVEVFYITNRDEKDRNGTQKNLEVYNLPNADARHLIMRQGTSSKEQRRKEVGAGYNVVLYLGDNLADFDAAFDKKTQEERDHITLKYSQEFGNRFIIIPNPVYGDWEAVLYQYNNNFTLAEKDSIIKAAGKTY